MLISQKGSDAVKELARKLIDAGYESVGVRGCGLVLYRKNPTHKYGDMPSMVCEDLGMEYQSLLSGVEVIDGVKFNGIIYHNKLDLDTLL